MCARNITGKGLSHTFQPGSLSFVDFQTKINEHIAHLKKVLFCGNLGDPCADNNLLDKIRWLKNILPDCTVGINTNGSIQNITWWKQLAQLLPGVHDYVIFSIDGLEDTNHIYRVGAQWKKVMENAQSFIDAGGSAQWDMLVFDHNKHQIDSAKELADAMGFTWFRSKETDRWDQYSVGSLPSFLNPANEFENIDYTNVNDIHCERNADCSEFIDYSGQTWPCCYIAEMHYAVPISYYEHRQKHKDILSHTTNELMTEYQTKLDADDPFYVCKRSCGKTLNKRSQWKQEIQLR